MSVVALAVSLLIGQAATPPAQPTAATTVSPVTVTAEPSVDPAAIAANLADMYEKSCGGRIYGTYAEACNNLAESLKQARASARKAARAQAAGQAAAKAAGK